MVNVTVAQPTAGGYVTAYPDGVAKPLASNLNFSRGETIPNLVIAPVGPDGKIDLYNGSAGTVQLIADVSGWFGTGTVTAPGCLAPLTPARVLDTRNGTGGMSGPVKAGATVSLPILGRGGVPAAGVEAVVLNVTLTQPTAGGYVTVYPDGVSRPTASNLNFGAGQTIPNLVIAPVGPDGKVDLYNGSGGKVQLIADVSGWFVDGAPVTGGLWPLTPARVLDTRSGTGGVSGPVGAGQTVKLGVLGAGGVPGSGVEAVVLNVTVTQPTAGGYVTVYPDGVSRPSASNLNFAAGQTIPNLVIAPVGPDGKVDLYNGSGGKVQLIADVSGWFGSGPVAPLGGVTSVTSDAVSSCGVLTSGGVDCWGTNDVGRLGDGTTGGTSDIPVAVSGLGGVGTLTGVVSLTSDGGGYCALLASGGVDCWGYGTDGALGDGSRSNSDLPAAVSGAGGVGTLSGVASLVSDDDGYCAVLASGGTVCWGTNDLGQLGNGNAGVGSSDIPVSVVGVHDLGTLAGVTSLVSDGVGGYCAVLGSGGAVCWGENTSGQLGNGSTTSSYSPTAVVGPGDEGTLAGVASLVSDQAGFCAVLTSGRVDCWGDNTSGELGDGTTIGPDNCSLPPACSTAPVGVVGVGGTGALSGVASLVGDQIDYCAVLTSGGLDCWGENTTGELGNGPGVLGDSASPVQVVGVGGAGTLSGVTDAIETGFFGVCAQLPAAKVACWGPSPTYPQTSSPVPAYVPGVGGSGQLDNVASLASNDLGLCAVLTTGGADCWGYGDYGGLGDGALTSSDVPVVVESIG